MTSRIVEAELLPARPAPRSTGRARAGRGLYVVVPVLSVAEALLAWEIVSRTELIPQRDLPAMSTSFGALWSMMGAGGF
jgi:ABC-type nitrate/sulfonate/bicarbonate transport system permease component